MASPIHGYDSPLTPKVCVSPLSARSRGIWLGDDPLKYSLPILMLQMSLISLVTSALIIILKPRGIPSVVSQIVGGIILGPSIIGRDEGFANKVFPFHGMQVLETFSLFGLMLFLFLIGVKLDINMILKSGKRATFIGVAGFIFPYALGWFVSSFLVKYLTIDPDISRVLYAIASVQSRSTFAVISCFLSELKILNSELGRLALSSSVISDIFALIIKMSKHVFDMVKGHTYKNSIGYTVSVTILVTFVVFVTRPVAIWINRQTPEGQPVKESYISSIITAVLTLGFISQVMGQTYYLIPLLMGVVIPDGPPLGAALEERLESCISGIFLPIFFTVCGLKTNLFTIGGELKNVWIIESIVLICFLAKIIATILPSLHCKMPLRDALSLALIMNSKGIIELAIYSEMLGNNFMNGEAFSILLVTVVIITSVISPIVKKLYDPSRRYMTYKRRTIKHHSRQTTLGILTCIHCRDNVPRIIKLLEASNPSNENPVYVCVLQLVKLVGRTSPLLVDHRRQNKYTTKPTRALINTFRYWEHNNIGSAFVNVFTSICPFETIDEDVCALSLDKRISLIVIPFHKQWLATGTVTSSMAIRNFNSRVLDKAPCSVGILVDHHNLKSSKFSIKNKLYSIAVFFFGGDDDQEALAYAERMASRATTRLTVIRFSSEADNPYDEEALNEFKFNTLDNDRVTYRVEHVTDGSEIVAMIRSMEIAYDLVLVGRRHTKSPITHGLTEWSEFPELGIFGDILATPDFEGVASVLVVQQQAQVWGTILQE
ncbi:hypothetical protein GIB67_007817 [Kingdonia uniflora]|uniref:Cation/H+ exchanger domain-containing protein n=1 Tax=Kingdonia uniflora TaxID=39325 RepID=A0A7J7N224_9MAGN|nr:hypothetical protein GIB67_007817 [Kingdonia uniflora]